MNSNPLITVLMPIYNAEKYLSQAIESILNQSFPQFEFLIINDGSIDNSSKIISKYEKGDSRINIVTHNSNKGLIFSLNEGLRLAKGQYIARMDADDISLSHRLYTQYSFMESHPNIAVVGSWADIIDRNGKSLLIKKTEKDPILLKFTTLFKCPLIHPSTLIRKDILIKENGYSSEAKYFEDHELWSRLQKQNHITNIQSVLIKYRIHPESVSLVNKIYHQPQFIQFLVREIKTYADISYDDFLILKSPNTLNLLTPFHQAKKRKIYHKIAEGFIAQQILTSDELESIRFQESTYSCSYIVRSLIQTYLRKSSINQY